MCDALVIPRSTYYESFSKIISNRERENNELTKRIIEIHNESNKCYVAPKIHKQLEKKGYKVSLKCFQRLIRRLVSSL